MADAPPLKAPRGRARSGAVHEDVDTDISADIEELNARIEGREPSPNLRRNSNSDPVPKTGQLSRKTITMLTDLNAATAPPEVIEHGRLPQPVETEEEIAERELAAQERRKRSELSSGDSIPTVVQAQPRSGGAKARKPDDKDYDLQVKLLLLGDGGVGKTSLMLRYSEDKFSTSLLSTAGVDYKTHYVDIEGRRVKCQIWDTAGQQRFHVITQSYYKGAHGIVLVYDVSDPTESSFNNVRYWMDNIRKHANVQAQKILIGNKIDVKGRKVDSARGRALADEYGMRFFETSAKDGTGVRDAFLTVARDVALKMIAAEGGAAGGAGAGAAGDKSGKHKDKDCTIM